MQAALGAAEMAGRKVKIFAVEKNPYAVVTLMTQVTYCCVLTLIHDVTFM